MKVKKYGILFMLLYCSLKEIEHRNKGYYYKSQDVAPVDHHELYLKKLHGKTHLYFAINKYKERNGT